MCRGVLFREALAAEGAVVFAKACELGLEGIVSKREGSFRRERFALSPVAFFNQGDRSPPYDECDLVVVVRMVREPLLDFGGQVFSLAVPGAI